MYEFRKMLGALVRHNGLGARTIAAAAGFPSAHRTLQRYFKTVKSAVQVEECWSEDELLEKQLEFVEELQLKEKGSADFMCRKIFNDDELEVFARNLIFYADMGWPMDYKQIGCMFAEAAKRKGCIDPNTGKAYVCGKDFVSHFVKSRPELHAYKTSHVDVLRAKKATYEVIVPSC